MVEYKVQVSNALTGDTTCTLTASRSSTVRDVKEQISQNAGVQVSKQSLVFNQEMLKDSDVLSHVFPGGAVEVSLALLVQEPPREMQRRQLMREWKQSKARLEYGLEVEAPEMEKWDTEQRKKRQCSPQQFTSSFDQLGALTYQLGSQALSQPPPVRTDYHSYCYNKYHKDVKKLEAKLYKLDKEMRSLGLQVTPEWVPWRCAKYGRGDLSVQQWKEYHYEDRTLRTMAWCIGALVFAAVAVAGVI